MNSQQPTNNEFSTMGGHQLTDNPQNGERGSQLLCCKSKMDLEITPLVQYCLIIESYLFSSSRSLIIASSSVFWLSSRDMTICMGLRSGDSAAELLLISIRGCGSVDWDAAGDDEDVSPLVLCAGVSLRLEQYLSIILCSSLSLRKQIHVT